MGIGKARAVWKEAVAQDKARPKSGRNRSEQEFLPAAIEVMETPPSPIGRAMTLLLCLFLLVALVWAWIGQIDVVAVAQGKIIPSGRVKLIQPAEIGVVRAIHVRDGANVKAGDLLVELDSTISGADRDRSERELLAISIDRARLEAMMASPTEPELFFSPPTDASEEIVATQRQLMRSETERLRSSLAGLDEEEKRRLAQLAGSKSQIEKLQRVVPLVRQNANAIGELTEQGYAGRLRHNEVLERLVTAEKDLQTEKSRLVEAEAGLAAIREQRKQVDSEFRSQVLRDLAAAKERQAGIEQELKKATQRTVFQSLRAPVDGTVQQLNVNTVGGVVQPAETLMLIVPQDSRLEVEVSLLNKDKGFVRTGQEAEVKFDAFPYTIYGIVAGRVSEISPDAITREKEGLIYLARVELDRTTISAQGQDVALGPGMAAAVEIKTGKRRVLEYMLDPLVRYRSEAMRER